VQVLFECEWKECVSWKENVTKIYTFDVDWIGTTKIGCNKYENIPHKECINAFHSVPAYIYKTVM
jgi:hypothetical protein